MHQRAKHVKHKINTHHWSPNTAPAKMALMVALKSTALPGAP